MDESDSSRIVKIGSGLEASLRDKLIKFLTKNVNSFAWSTEDMPGIDPSVICHELHVDTSFKPVKQKRRKLGPDRTKAVNDEVERLLKVGSI